MPEFTGSVQRWLPGQDIRNARADNWGDILDAAAGAWNAFAPTFAATGGGAVIGNGTIAAKYRRTGKSVLYAGVLTAGSSTTFGTGVLTLTMPYASLDQIPIGSALAIDSSALTGSHAGVTRLRSTTLLELWADEGGQMTAAVPFAFGNGDSLYWTIEYEVA